MTDKFALLTDLVGLVKKHGPEVFSDLARFLRNPDTLAELVTILEAAETVGRKARVGESRAPRKHAGVSKGGIRQLLSELEKDHPDKAQVLSGLYDALAAKRALPTLGDLRSFAIDNGLAAVRASSRDKAISSLLRDLASRPIEDIRSMLRRVRVADGGDRTLEGWTDVILGRHRSRGGGA